MIYLLIDTCTLLQLVDENGYNKYLIELENLIKREDAYLFTHKLIIEEWQRHKTKIQSAKERRLLSYNNKSKDQAQELNNLLPSIPVFNTNHIDQQMAQIDNLLATAKILETPPGIASEFAERYRKNLAPLIGKGDNQNDWEIIGTICNHCEQYSIKELFFLSHNHKHFADPVSSHRKIHPEIQTRFDKVKIHYFKNYSDFFNEFNTFLPVDLIPYQITKNEKFSRKATLRSNVLESLYYIYNELYAEINFIPIHILKEFYPFSKAEDSNVFYSIFVLSGVNEGLFAFFENISIKDNKEIEFKDESILKNIPDYKYNIEFVLRHLTQNLIFDLSGEKLRKRVDIHYHNPKKNCDCYICCFNRFEFHKTFKNLKNNSSDIKENLKAAYIHCELGNFQSAIILYEKILKDSQNQKCYISYFISKYNLRHLGNFLRNFSYNKKVDYKKSKELLNIDSLEEAIKLKGHTDSNLLSFIATEDFFSTAFQNITKERNNILDHYYSQLNGGYSSNQNVWNLICEFANLDSFLNNNYIIYDMYSNFNELFALVTEALLASHAINEKQSSRFVHFDDYWVSKFIIYGNWKRILEYFNRYNLKVLKYKSSSTEQDTFMDLYGNLLTNEQLIRQSVLDFADENSNFFRYKYNKMFQNAIVMASLLDLDENINTECATLLLSFLIEQKLLDRPSFEIIKLFIKRNQNKLNDDTLFGFIDFFIKNETSYQMDILESLIDSLTIENIEKLPEENFNSLLNGLFKDSKTKNTSSDFLIINLYKKVNAEKKRIILNIVHSSLTKNPNFQHYYLYSINDIITLDQNKIITWIDEFNVEIEKPSIRSFFGADEDYQNDHLNELLNLCFKYDINTTAKEFKKLNQVHSYYEWIIDMDNFDYSKFNPEWVLNYQTKFYIKKMSLSIELKKALVSYLKNNSHRGIERALIRITYFVYD